MQGALAQDEAKGCYCARDGKEKAVIAIISYLGGLDVLPRDRTVDTVLRATDTLSCEYSATLRCSFFLGRRFRGFHTLWPFSAQPQHGVLSLRLCYSQNLIRYMVTKEGFSKTYFPTNMMSKYNKHVSTPTFLLPILIKVVATFDDTTSFSSK